MLVKRGRKTVAPQKAVTQNLEFSALRMHPEMAAALKRHARQKGITFSELARDALRSYMERQGIKGAY